MHAKLSCEMPQQGDISAMPHDGERQLRLILGELTIISSRRALAGAIDWLEAICDMNTPQIINMAFDNISAAAR